MHKRKVIQSGPLLEVIDYPAAPDGKAVRGEKSKRTAEENKIYNDKKQRKKLTRKAAANFGAEDYFMHFTYDLRHSPDTVEEAQRDMANYFRRVRNERRKEARELDAQIAELDALGINNEYIGRQRSDLEKRRDRCLEPLKYMYVTESKVYKQGERAGRESFHFHALISGGLSADKMKKLWTKGERVRCDSYMPDEYGPEAAIDYMFKEPRGRRRIICSKGLSEPVEKEYKNGYTNRGIRQIYQYHRFDAEYWERKHPGYKFIKCDAIFNTYNNQWYLSLMMYRTDAAAPDWARNTAEGWFEDPWRDI